MLEDSEIASSSEVVPSIIHWTKHAISRVAERFGFKADIKIPNRIILKQAALTQDGEQFRLRRGKVIYVCKVERPTVIILTVLYADRLDAA